MKSETYEWEVNDGMFKNKITKSDNSLGLVAGLLYQLIVFQQSQQLKLK